MNPRKLLALALSLALPIAATGSAFAKSTSPASARGNTRPELPKIKSDEATIEKVGSLSISVKCGKKVRNYGLDDHTEILISRRRSSAGALQKGMVVSVHPSTMNPTMAQSITVDDPTVRIAEAPKPAAVPKKPTKPAAAKPKTK